MAGTKTRLFKIASEINVGKDAIVEFLQSKGHSIENKPTSVLTEEMVVSVLDKFKKEKRAAEVQRSKIQKHKEIRKPSKGETDDESHTQLSTKPETVVKAPNKIVAKDETASDIEVVQAKLAEAKSLVAKEVNSNANISKQEASFTESKVQKSSNDVSEKVSQPPNAKSDDLPSLSKEVKETPKESIKQESIKDDSSKVEKLKSSNRKVKETTTENSSDKPVVEYNRSKENQRKQAQADAAAEQKDLKANQDESDLEKEANAKKRKKRKKIVEVDLGEPNNLKGLTIVGKIALESERAKQQDDNRKPRFDRNRPNDRRGSRPGQENRPEGGYNNRFGDRNRANTGDENQDRGADRDNRGFRDNRGGNFRNNENAGNRPPRDDNRPPRFDNRPPRDGNRPPRDDNRPPRDGNRPPRDDNRPPRDDNRPPRDGNRPPRDGNRPPRDDNRPPRDGNRPPRDNRSDNRPGFQRRDSQAPREGSPYREKPGIFGGGNQPQKDDPQFVNEDKKKLIKTKKTTFGGDAAGAAADKNKRKKKSIREQISAEDVNRAIRKTLSGMADASIASARTKAKQKKKIEREEKVQKAQEEFEKEQFKLSLTEFVTTNDLANLMRITPSEIILKCMQLGLMVTINQRLDKDTITLIADDYGYEVDFQEDEVSEWEEEENDLQEDLFQRAPIVTIMGHVDHGKTSLLDYLRSSSVVAGESGGITQHIGAYKVPTRDGKSVTFLDTPGHEAFTAMRARGAQVTDIVVLIVAADDSVMPQTVEAISHAKAANVPIVVAINKIDKPDANVDRIRQQLADYDVLVEDWGGKHQCAEISAKFGKNIDILLDKILLEAEILELKANPTGNPRGSVIESHMDKGLGVVSTVIIQRGTLSVGDSFVAGAAYGKVRGMFDEGGNKIEKAEPSVPARIIGFEGMPVAGDKFIVVKNDSDARKIANERRILKREQELRQMRHVTLDDISKQIQLGGVKDLLLILKGDVSGSVEALSDSLLRLSKAEVRVVILHKGVGAITESDVMLAKASGAIILGFHVTPTPKAQRMASEDEIDIREYEIIYDCINEVQLALEGMLRPEFHENVSGAAEVRKVFKTSKIGAIAGCYIIEGKITRNDKARILRDGFPIHTSSIGSLKREKDDVKEVDSGFECGIVVDGYNDYQVGDVIETFKVVEVKRKLKDAK